MLTSEQDAPLAQKGFLQTAHMGKDLLLFPFQAKQMGLQCVMYIYRKIFQFMASLSPPRGNRMNVYLQRPLGKGAELAMNHQHLSTRLIFLSPP